MTGAERFSAREASLGYLYQVRLALLWALRKTGSDSSIFIALETLDDIVFESGSEPSLLLQAKHHTSRVASLSDSSPDIWKTFRVWLVAQKSLQAGPHTSLALVTTAQCKPGSAASMLSANVGRDEKNALSILRTIAQTSQSETNAEGYRLFLELPEIEQLAFLSRVAIIGSSPSVLGLEDDLKYELRHWVSKSAAAYAISMLEGWWFARVVQQLAEPRGALPISLSELEAQIDDIREQFKPANLPVDEELLTAKLDAATITAFTDYDFARQVKLVTTSQTRLRRAIADYFRAFTQRSNWLRNDLLQIGELERYESELFEAWELEFARMEEELGPEPTSDVMMKAGSKMLGWAESGVNVRVRPEIAVHWVCRGTLHQMADRRQVGWHTKFLTLLEPSNDAKDEEAK